MQTLAWSTSPKMCCTYLPYRDFPIPYHRQCRLNKNATLPFTPGKTYCLRIINTSAFSAFFFWIEGHEMRIIEANGVDTQESPLICQAWPFLNIILFPSPPGTTPVTTGLSMLTWTWSLIPYPLHSIPVSDSSIPFHGSPTQLHLLTYHFFYYLQ